MKIGFVVVATGLNDSQTMRIVNFTKSFRGRIKMKNCKECIYSKIITPKNSNCVPEAVCILSDEEFHDCLSNNHSKFEGNLLYLMIGGEE